MDVCNADFLSSGDAAELVTMAGGALQSHVFLYRSIQRSDLLWKMPEWELVAAGSVTAVVMLIFLMQQLWFCIKFPYRMQMRVRYACVLDIIICVFTGVAFYYLHNYAGKSMRKAKIGNT